MRKHTLARDTSLSANLTDLCSLSGRSAPCDLVYITPPPSLVADRSPQGSYFLCLAMQASTSSTSSEEPRKMGERWWIASGCTSRMLTEPLVDLPPACRRQTGG